MPPGYHPPVGAEPLEGGVPWENPQLGLISRLWETFKAVNFDTRRFFAAASQSDDGVTACLYGAVNGGLTGFVTLGLSSLLMTTAVSTAFTAFSGKIGTSSLSVGLGMAVAYAVMGVILGAGAGFLSPWVIGGLHHLLLMLFKGTSEQREYAHSVRVFAYATFAAIPLLIIPVLGALAFMVLMTINLVRGYSEMHGASIGKVILALMPPVICCCGCYFGYMAMILAIVRP